MSFGKPSIITSLSVGTDAVLVLQAQEWQVVTFLKNTSGTLVIGTRSEIVATNNGGGIPLVTGQPTKLFLGPGTNIYAVASAANEALGVHIQYLDMIPLVVNSLVNLARPVSAPNQALRYPGQAGFRKALNAAQKKGG